MPRKFKPTEPQAVTYRQLMDASGLNQYQYQSLMQTSQAGIYNRLKMGAIKNDAYTELALLHADAHPFYKLVRRETGDI